MRGFLSANDTGEAGVMLVEVLVVVALLGVLSGLSMHTFGLLRQRGYEAQIDALVHQQKLALEAGQVELAGQAATFYSRFTTIPGSFVAWGGENFVPGLINPEDVQMNVWYNGFCASGLSGSPCPLSGGWIRHCDAKRSRWWMRWSDGVESVQDMAVPWAC